MRHFLRLALFALGSLAAAALLATTGLAWTYSHMLTRPACLSPQPIPGMPDPQELTLSSADGRALPGWYYAGSRPLGVLILGGQHGSLGQNLPPAGFLIEAGYPVLQVDSRACAHPPGRVTLGAQEALDASAGVDALLAQPGVARVAAFGFSMGGVSAIRLAARDPRVAAVIAEGGYDNLGRHILDAGSQTNLFQRGLVFSIAAAYQVQTGVNPWKISPIDDLASLSPRPVLLIYGEHELTSGHGDRQYSAALQPKTLWVVPNGDHGTNYQAAPDEYRRQVLEFLENSQETAP